MQDPTELTENKLLARTIYNTLHQSGNTVTLQDTETLIAGGYHTLLIKYPYPEINEVVDTWNNRPVEEVLSNRILGTQISCVEACCTNWHLDGTGIVTLFDQADVFGMIKENPDSFRTLRGKQIVKFITTYLKDKGVTIPKRSDKKCSNSTPTKP